MFTQEQRQCIHLRLDKTLYQTAPSIKLLNSRISLKTDAGQLKLHHLISLLSVSDCRSHARLFKMTIFVKENFLLTLSNCNYLSGHIAGPFDIILFDKTLQAREHPVAAKSQIDSNAMWYWCTGSNVLRVADGNFT